ncbi:mechanosensitive ion channel domain-containing protein [Halobacterium sp. KA-6]|uniref:mechanosensitive ion channel domain-containing protein n=1 Tax=Halobacterium sp. KA-6 TaxID=2896368 RepID=UPI001E30BD89|nr:mechanosensitive ion channel domain-containing protein [Halobacterium sp. KA-6]MCD2203507.1 mechanosensitive ion channel family protein [Halobacterium sp. KA-6]
MQVDFSPVLDPDFRYVLAVAVLFAGLALGYLIGRVNERLLLALDVDEAVEGTSIERMAHDIGASTVSLVARLTSWIIYAFAVLVALEVARLTVQDAVWYPIVGFLPSVVIAVAVLFFGVLAGDKAELFVSERLRSVKVPEMSVLPKAVKYSVLFVAALVALSQVGVAIDALLVLLAAYVGALILFTAVATHQLLTSAASGAYLLLRQPYGIGDRVAIGEHEGIVQEVNVFVTRVEDDGREYVLPNHLVFKRGVVVVRE